MRTAKHIGVIVSLVLFFVVSIGGIFAFAPAQAAPVEDLPQTTQRLAIFKAEQTNLLRKEAKKETDNSITAAILGGVLEMFSNFTRQMAYDTAIWVANGGKGKGALIFQGGFNEYMSKTIGDSVASGIGEIGKPFGLNLCQVPDARLSIFLKVNLFRLYSDAPTANCSWQQLTHGGLFDRDAWDQKYGDSNLLADTFSTSLNTNSTDLGIAMGAIYQIDRLKGQKKEAAKLDRQEGSGFKPVTSLISGKVLTPGQLVKKETEKLTRTEDNKLSSQQLAGVYSAGFAQVLPSAASLFLNTVASEMLNNVFEGLFPDPGVGSKGTGLGGLYASEISANKQAVDAIFGKLLTGVPVKQQTDFDLSQFAACPANPGLNNCVFDAHMQRILAQANNGNAVTIGEALEDGLLPDWPLISPRREADHTNITGCQTGKFCYSNIQKMRKVRILPLGFEIAAFMSDPENPWRLKQVVDNYDTCRRDINGTIIPDAQFPFCGLINPNWVLRAPVARCETTIIGPELISPKGAARRSECADITTCITEGPNGTCVGDQKFAYCTKESNTWQIGDQCPKEYNTCRTLSNRDSGEVVSYLLNTVDYGQCSAENKGCQAYSLEKNGDAYVASVSLQDAAAVAASRKAAGRNQVLYFNEKAAEASATCSSGSDGCTQFLTAEIDNNTRQIAQRAADDEAVAELGVYFQSQVPVNLRYAPDYLGCYDTNPETDEIEWPQTAVQARLSVSQDERCNDYAPVCAPEEIGCQAYLPSYQGVAIGGEPMVPGKIGSSFVCDASCEGYDTFKQIGFEEYGAGFEQQQFPLHFIPNQAQSCNAQVVGCDEFTNIDAGAAGETREYYTSLRYCQKPAEDGSNQKTFYTWEGSIEDGFSLKTFRILPVDQAELAYIQNLNLAGDLDDNYQDSFFGAGSPAYVDDMKATLINNYEVCNEENYQIRVDNPLADGAADDECRAIFDDDGNTYYRLVDQLVTISDACHPLRKTEANLIADNDLQAGVCANKGGLWDQGAARCMRCSNGGAFDEDSASCIYQTISSADGTQSCTGPANNVSIYEGCRAYVGNNGRNIERVFIDDFESQGEEPAALAAARGAWGPEEQVRVLAEAVDVGQHSLLVEHAGQQIVTRALGQNNMVPGASYEISFWAQGNGTQLSVFLGNEDISFGSFTFDRVLNRERPLTIGGGWQEYRLGPVEFNGAEEDLENLALWLQGTPVEGEQVRYFIDKVVLKRLPENLYLIKDSWKAANGGADVPALCDAEPNNGLPGAALGCREYIVETTSAVHYATGFEQLCREEAIGCQPLWNTQNTINGEQPTKARAYQAYCAGPDLQVCEVVIGERVAGSCQIKQNEPGCYVEEPIVINAGEVLDAAYISDSTVIVPADTPIDAPIFLANREEFQCQDDALLGCMLVGKEKQYIPDALSSASYTHEEVFVKNDPSLYSTILCRDDQVGCGQFSDDSGDFYFKDPVKTGQSLCYYNDQGAPYGWFKKDVGQCSQNNDIECIADADCGETHFCQNKGKVQCYDGGFLRAGGFSDIRAAGDPAYANMVGLCSPENNKCTELLDRADTDNGTHPDGTPYYVIFDRDITERISKCEGNVSLNDGCVLFDKTDNPNKIFDTDLTYAASEGATPPFSSVPAVSNNNNAALNDANIVLKVQRDRECSEWLSCKTSVPRRQDDGTVTDLCYEYAACSEFGEDGNCINWVEDVQGPNGIPESTSRLTYKNYIQRDQSWYGFDYVGYSLFDKYQINYLKYLFLNPSEYAGLTEGNVVKPEFKDLRSVVVYEQPSYTLDQNRPDGQDNNPLSCLDKSDFESCGFVQDGVNKGRCLRGRCIYPVEGVFEGDISDEDDADVAFAQLERNSCKNFPEEDSPFSTFIGGNDAKQSAGNRYTFITKKEGFANANICQDGNCSCGYTKYTYANGEMDYWQNANIKGICINGDTGKIGGTCTADRFCFDAQNRFIEENGERVANPEVEGACSLVEEKLITSGFQGYCLEYDYSRPINGNSGDFACLTWLPADVSASGANVFNANFEAGFNLEQDAENFRGAYCVESTQVAARPHAFAYEQDILDTFLGNGEGSQWDRFLQEGVDVAQYEDFIDAGLLTRVYGRYQEWLKDGQAWPPRQAEINELGENFPFYVNPPVEDPETGGVLYPLPLLKENARYPAGITAEYWGGDAQESDDEYAENVAGEGERGPGPASWWWFLDVQRRGEVAGRDDWHLLDQLHREYLAFLNANEIPEGDKTYFVENLQAAQGDQIYHPGFINIGARRCEKGLYSYTAGDYANLVCNQPNPKTMATIAQEWAWRVLGDSTLVLRAEQAVYKEKNNQTRGGQVHDVDAPNVRVREKTIDDERLSQLGPQNPRRLMPSFLAAAPDEGAGKTYGVIMHPPRDFSGEIYKRAMKQISYESTVREYDFIYPIMYSPGNVYQPRTVAQAPNDAIYNPISESLFRLDQEAFIKESDLRRVYFTPSAIAGGFDYQMFPPMWSNEFYIDFTKLRNLPVKREIRAVHMARPCNPYGKWWKTNEVFPSMIPDSGCRETPKLGAAALTYMLEGRQIRQPETVTFEMDEAIDYNEEMRERNHVARRYIAIFTNVESDKSPFLQGTGCGFTGTGANCEISDSKISATPDFFDREMECIRDERDATESWFAIGMDFNSNGEFLGYVSKACSYGDRTGVPQMVVVADLLDQCTALAQVYKEFGQGDDMILQNTNKAWTNRTWGNALDIARLPEPALHPSNAYRLVNDRNEPVKRESRDMVLYGAITIEARNLQENATPAEVDELFNKLRDYSFEAEVDGVSYSCYARYAGLPYNRGREQMKTCEAQDASRIHDNESLGNLHSQELINTLSGNDWSTAKRGVLQLFAQIHRLVSIDTYTGLQSNDNRMPGLLAQGAYSGQKVSPQDDRTKYGAVDTSYNGTSARPGEILLPPQIYSLNPFTCIENSPTESNPCTIGEYNNITINGKNGTDTDYDGDGIAEEVGRTGEARAIASVGSELAIVNFFVAADDNRMPIRRIKMDWGDENIGGILRNEGLYKNAKPFCESSDSGGRPNMGLCVFEDNPNIPTNLTCKTAGENQCGTGMVCKTKDDLRQENNGFAESYQHKRFGNTPRACDDQYVEMTHSYTCGLRERDIPGVFVPVTNLLEEYQQQLEEMGVGRDEEVCYYKPRVQVLDNWGWCNGSCDISIDIDGDGVGDGCSDVTPGPLNTIEEQCSDTAVAEFENAWTEYQGAIIVVPKPEVAGQ